MTMATPTETPELMRVPSGIAGLDTILCGGFMRGGVYILQGAPGAGKTIATNQICFHHVAGGGKALFVTLLAENHARLITNLEILTFFDQSRIPDQISYLSALDEVRDGGLKQLLDLLRREILKRRITLLVIDGLVSARTIADSEQAFREYINNLQEVALATDCTMFLTTTHAGAISPEQTMVDGLIDLTNRTYGWQAASDLEVTKFRGSGFLRGRHSYKITDDGLVVYPRMEAQHATPSRLGEAPIHRISTGVSRLDDMLDGGLTSASTTMVLGPSGIGKTTLGLHFLSGSSVDEPGLMVGFYETPARISQKAARIDPQFAANFDNGAIELLWQTPTSDLLDAYGQRLLEAVHRRGVKRLFIDGLTALQTSSIDPPRVANFFAALANELRALDVATVYTLEVPDTIGLNVKVPADYASSLAENMIYLRYLAQRSRRHRIVSIVKARDSDFDSSLREFKLTGTGMEISDSPDSAEAILADMIDSKSDRFPTRES